MKHLGSLESTKECLFESWLEFLSFLSGRHLLNSTDGVQKPQNPLHRFLLFSSVCYLFVKFVKEKVRFTWEKARNYLKLAEPAKNAAIMLADRWPLTADRILRNHLAVILHFVII